MTTLSGRYSRGRARGVVVMHSVSGQMGPLTAVKKVLVVSASAVLIQLTNKTGILMPSAASAVSEVFMTSRREDRYCGTSSRVH